MSVPEMKGYTGMVPTFPAEILDTSDDRAFRLGVVEPGGEVVNYDGHWYNFGYSYLYDGQLSLIAHPALDSGAAADTTDVMNLTAKAADALAMTTAATSTNTAGWTIPLPSPFRPYLDYFPCGIRWRPPALAAVLFVRKAFQWDGSYYPDTWDFMYYPMSNGYGPENVGLDIPMQRVMSSMTQLIQADGLTSTGYRVKYNITTLATAQLQLHHSSGTEPWYVSVNNATGWVFEISFQTYNPCESTRIRFRDGTYIFDFDIYSNHIVVAGSPSYVMNTYSAYNLYSIRVLGTDCKVYLNGSLIITEVLGVASASKSVGINIPSGGVGTATQAGDCFNIDYLKYFLNGNTPPVH